MRDSGDVLTLVQGTIIAVLLAIMAGRVIGPVEILRRPPGSRTAMPAPTPTPYQRSWTPMRRD